MEDDNWYTRLAKAGYLGTKAQVAAQYGNPTWKPDQDPMAQALKNQAKKGSYKEEESSDGSY